MSTPTPPIFLTSPSPLHLRVFRSTPVLTSAPVHTSLSPTPHAQLRSCTLIIFRSVYHCHRSTTSPADLLHVLPVHALHFLISPFKPPQYLLHIKTPAHYPPISLVLTDRSHALLWERCLRASLSTRSISWRDLSVSHCIGRGGFGRAFLVKLRPRGRDGGCSPRGIRGDMEEGEWYVVKEVKKKVGLRSRTNWGHVITERDLLAQFEGSCWYLGLAFAFQTRDTLCMGTRLCEGGDVGGLVRERGIWERVKECGGRGKWVRRLGEKVVKKIMAETLIALEGLHELNVVYRDLKPENLLLDGHGHVVIGDFGLAKRIGMGMGQRLWTKCGTRGYKAPEVETGMGYGKEVDVWGWGGTLYKLVSGRVAYEKCEECEHGECKGERELWWDGVSDEVRDLVEKCLREEREERIGVNGIKSHKLFDGVNWGKVRRRGGRGVKGAGLREEGLEDEMVMGEGKGGEGEWMVVGWEKGLPDEFAEEEARRRVRWGRGKESGMGWKWL